MIEVREIIRSDIREITALEQANFSDAWSEKSIEESYERTHTLLLGAYKNDEIIGYLIAYYVLDEGEIVRIAVAKDHRRIGAGRQLLKTFEDMCAKKSIYRLFLEVRESNVSAIAFYKKQGFRQDGIRKNFYTNPAEDGILMNRELGR